MAIYAIVVKPGIVDVDIYRRFDGCRENLEADLEDIIKKGQAYLVLTEQQMLDLKRKIRNKLPN